MHGTKNKHLLLDTVKEKLNLRTDSALALLLGFCREHVTFVRCRYRATSDEMLVAMHLASDIEIKELKRLRVESNEPEGPRTYDSRKARAAILGVGK